MRKEVSAFEDRVTVEFLSGLSTEALKKRLGDLDSSSVVFTPGFFRDGGGQSFVPREAARLVAGASGAPVYGPYPTFIGSGVMGGSMASYVTMGRMAADAALALLAGTAPSAVVLPKIMPNQVHVDWRQARRFGIDAEAVPADAVVSFKEPSFWEAYGHFVLIAGAVMLIQSGLIAALLFERRRRRRTASALAQSEQRMSLAAQAARLSMWSWDVGRTQKPRARPGAAQHRPPARRLHRLQGGAGEHRSAGPPDRAARGRSRAGQRRGDGRRIPRGDARGADPLDGRARACGTGRRADTCSA